jgi:hypothetical protein
MNPLATKKPGQKATDSTHPVTHTACSQNLSPTMHGDWLKRITYDPFISDMAAQSVTSGPPESQVYADADPTAQQRAPLSPMSI